MSEIHIEKLMEMKAYGGARKTLGLAESVICQHIPNHPKLVAAIDEAYVYHQELRGICGNELALDEVALIEKLQQGYLNFYGPAAVNPYVALGARGPWVVTSHGAVLHDSGGYGMLGNGHGPDYVIDAMSNNWVMANVMTASFSQKRFAECLKAEIGHNRATGFPYHQIVCLNSGSEAVSVATRICDINAKSKTDSGARHAGRTIKILSLAGAFHGRTDRPAQISDSSIGTYRDTMASFRDRDNLITVNPNDVEGLKQAFVDADNNNIFIEAVFIEPVMGEGVPGRALERGFYDWARKLTLKHGSLLVIDSIQAGFRGTGNLSITDYPGFEDCDVPDMETYSKALNAGQYPFSVLALSSNASKHYVRGVYGNTMTTNPRALEAASAVLENITEEIRCNIRDRGVEFVAKLKQLAEEIPGVITQVEGTGLLLCVELDPDRLRVVGFGGVEEYCRTQGIGVIHGGKNALRFTPHFTLTSEEIDLIIGVVRSALTHLLTKADGSPHM